VALSRARCARRRDCSRSNDIAENDEDEEDVDEDGDEGNTDDDDNEEEEEEVDDDKDEDEDEDEDDDKTDADDAVVDALRLASRRASSGAGGGCRLTIARLLCSALV
jgi:hypothetical protein